MTMPGNERSEEPEFLYSPVVQGVANGSFGAGGGLTWDAFTREIYEKAGKAIQNQANELLKRGNVSVAEAKQLVEGTRNKLLLELRSRLTPFGRLYSEILKPRHKLPNLESLLAQKGTIEAVLTSVGKSRASVNRFAAACRIGGPATILIQFTFSGVIITLADPEDRARVSAGQAGSLAGATVGGLAGMWAGCAGLSTLASPSLVLPVVGPFTTGTACIIGGIAGGFGAGWVGGLVGQWGGEGAYDFVMSVQWEWR